MIFIPLLNYGFNHSRWYGTWTPNGPCSALALLQELPDAAVTTATFMCWCSEKRMSWEIYRWIICGEATAKPKARRRV